MQKLNAAAEPTEIPLEKKILLPNTSKKIANKAISMTPAHKPIHT